MASRFSSIHKHRNRVLKSPFHFAIKSHYGKILLFSTWGGRNDGNVLFNDTLNTFYFRLYGVGHMVKDHSDSERGNPLPPHGLLFPFNNEGFFICTIPQTG